ncbi:MAG: hypothetical protein JNJ70_24635 [Verrucomicrobiales bacterium]|nr:hypothetical protein [Verrucomicrobiales bacterium]
MFNFNKTAKKALDILASATGLRLVPDPLLPPAGKDVCILDIQGYRQVESYTCGFVAGAMILHTFHHGASLRRFFEQCSPDREMGLQQNRLVRSLRANGIGVGLRHDLDFENIAATLEQGYPIITLTKTERSDVIHWVVIYGYGRRPNRVFIAGEGLPLINNLTGHKEIPWPRFSRSKWANRGFGLVCWGK